MPHADDRAASLARELELYKNHLALIEEIDDALEVAILHKWPVSRTMDAILEDARARLGATVLFVRTIDEHERPVDFASPDLDALPGLDLDAVCATVRDEGEVTTEADGMTLLGYRLDVTDLYLGSVVIAVTDEDPLLLEHRQIALKFWCEQLDNYLAAIADARRKQRALRELSDALRAPILDVGIDEALGRIQRYVPFTDLTLVLKYEEASDQASTNYRVLRGDTIVGSSQLPDDDAHATRTDALSALHGGHGGLTERFGLASAREDALVLASDGVTVVGRVSVGLEGGEALTPFARDVLERFADYIRHRVVDFNKEWKQLSKNFPQEVVRRLLLQSAYYENYLSPRERDVAIMYCDIAGFTRMSEKVLKEPKLIGELIDTWSNTVVEFIWESGGVFDKMVGDCIIGLWGPPFFERSPREVCEAAATAALKIREYTNTLARGAGFPQLATMDPPIGVATGLNFCPLFVGTFGPDENYTGFSSGMNNTARLQGVAERDEIFCMDTFVAALDAPERFGPVRHASVKNVADPLAYHDLER
jgi:class 3 adenylate cyclase